MKTAWHILAAVVLYGMASSLPAAEYYVARNDQTPASPFTSWEGAASNIQEAVDQAAAGDTVWVGPGTYTIMPGVPEYSGSSNVVYMGNAITLRSSSGNPTDTIIDAENAYRGVWMQASSGQPVLDGFTIRNGWSGYASGGVFVFNNGPAQTATVQNCIIEDCFAQPDNYGRQGGGICDYRRYDLDQVYHLVISNTTVRGCSTNGIYTTTYSASGGVTIADCLIEDNVGAGLIVGGGACTNNIIKNSIFRHNERFDGGYGVGVASSRRHQTIRNCLFYGNRNLSTYPSANYYGGAAIGLSGTAATNWIESCTIVSNYCTSGGKAISQHRYVQVTHLKNTIIRYNADEIYGFDGGANLGISATQNDPPTWTNCLLHIEVSGEGNITKDPEFQNLDAGDCRLRPWSSGVDAGRVFDWMGTATDLAGNPRISDNGLVDMGAYETSIEPRPIHYVAQNGQTPVAPYTNLNFAASNIQDAVDAASADNTEIVQIEPGRYTAVDGGTNFLGDNLVYIDKPLILRGSPDAPGDVILDGEGTYRGVIFHYPYTSGEDFIVDGITFSNCFATNCGGGLLFHSNNQVWTGEVSNAVFTHNTVGYGGHPGYFNNNAGSWGGGIGVWNLSCNFGMTVSNTVFRHNEALHGGTGLGLGSVGGAIYIRANGAQTFVECVFANNQSLDAGGISVSGASFENCIFQNNIADVGDSGLSVYYAGSGAIGGGAVTLRNCLLHGNRAQRGGGLYLTAGINYIFNSTIVSNIGTGGGIRMRFSNHANNSRLRIWNSIICSNSTDISIDSDITQNGDVALTVTNSLFFTGNAMVDNLNLYDAPHANIAQDPQFEDYVGQNFRPKPSSPCIDAGMNLPGMETEFDLDGRARLDNQAQQVDMGCYEYSYVGTTIMIH